MGRDIKEYVKCCQRCKLGKTPEPAARAPLESIRTSAPMELVCIDFWRAEDSKQRSFDVLVITDHFTKLAHAFPCVNQTAKQVAKELWDNVFCIYGVPNPNPILKVNSLPNSSQGLQKHTQQHTIPWEMGKPKGSIGRLAVCCVPYREQPNNIGPNRYRL